MRKLAWVALFALVIALFFWLTLGSETQSRDSPAVNKGTASFGIYSSEMADAGNKSAAVLHLFLFPSGKGSVTLACSQKPLQKDVIILKHPAAPGVNESLAKKISLQLAACGLSVREANASVALASQNSLIIVPSGATPAVLAENQALLQERNDRVIVFSMLQGRMIDEAGGLFAANTSENFETVELAPGGEDASAKETALLSLFPKGDSVKSAGWEGDRTLALMMNGSRAYCRAIYIEDGSCRFAESGLLEKPEGHLSAPQSALVGQAQKMEFELASGSEIGRRLRFFAIDFAGREEAGRQEIAGGEIRGGWASAFSMNFSKAGIHIVKVEDQFKRLHASAYVEVQGLWITQVSQQGNRYEFNASFGEKPLDGPVSAWLDGGEPQQFFATGGKLVVWATPSDAGRTMHFTHGGASGSIQIPGTANLPENFAKYGLPVLVFLVALYLMARARRKIKYTIVFPEFAEPELKILPVTCQEVFLAWKAADTRLGGHLLAAYPEEIARELARKNRMDAQGLRRVLSQLVQQGDFAESEGAYAPKSAMGIFTIGQLAALRLLHDVMLERGMPFARKMAQQARGMKLEIAIFAGTASVLARIGSLRRAVLFESAEDRESFLESLSVHSPENTRIKLAIQNGKVLLVTAARNELEAVLF